MTAVSDETGRETCQCPKCGRMHQIMKFGAPPKSIMANCDRDGAKTDLPEDIRIPLHELQADVDYLVGRIVADGSCAPAISETIKSKLRSVELTTRAALSAAPVGTWECSARKQSLPEPTDCGWPTCGCDPHADKVIAALEEQGHAAPVAQEPVASPGAESEHHLGWLFFNPDAGTEWADSHPIESGECEDAEELRPATLNNLKEELLSTWRDRERDDRLLNGAIEFLLAADGITALSKLRINGNMMGARDIAQQLRGLEIGRLRRAPPAPAASVGAEEIARVLRDHWLTGTGCDPVNKTNKATCSCSLWSSDVKQTQGEAVEAWIAHILSLLSRAERESDQRKPHEEQSTQNI